MGTVYPELDDRLIRFITSQPVFFVATAPGLDADGTGGHVNVSPKGYRDTFAVLDTQGDVMAFEGNPDGLYQLFRIGDAVSSRNIHAAIYDALRLCVTL